MNIVIIDDEIILSRSIEKKLLSEGYQVKTLHSYEAFIEYDFTGVDIVLLDLTLKDGSGFDILKKLKFDEKKTQLTVIIMSGNGEVDVKIRGLDMGADDYLVKPFSPDELLARLRTHQRKLFENLQQVQILQYGDIYIDLKTRSIYKNNILINFTKKEKNIFIFFCQNFGKLISRKELVNKFWNTSYHEKYDNIVNVTLFKIRKKIGNSLKLDTLLGEGYILKQN